MAGALTEFSRRPLQFKVLVFGGIGVLLGLLYWQFMMSPLIKERDGASADLDGQKAEQGRLRQQKKKYDELVAAEAKLRADIEQNQKALPTEAEMPAFIDMLSRKSGEAGIELVKRDIKADIVIDAVAAGAAPAAPGAAPSSFVKVPVELEVIGTYYQIKKFMASLRPRRAAAPSTNPDSVEEKDRIVTIEALTISNPMVKNNEIILTARFTASTFRAKVSEAAPAAAPAPKPAPPPAGAPATGPAVKPDTMKAKTEKAMDASDGRVQKAVETSGGDKADRDPPAGGGVGTGSAVDKGVDRLKGGM